MVNRRITASEAYRRLPGVRVVVAVTIALAVWVAGVVPTADGGERHREDPARHYSGVYFWAPDVGWVADVQDVVLTRDGGRTWTPILSVYGPPRGFESISRIGTLNPQLWWFENAGNLWKTTDQGRTWSSQRIPNIGGIVFVAPTEAWAIRTEGEALMHTQDGGRTWQPVPLRGIDTRRLKIRRLTFLSPQVGWGEVGDGNVVQTTDGGRTWGLRGKAPGGFRLFMFADAQTGFALDLRAPKIYRTRDGGATWETAQLTLAPGVPLLTSLYALDPRTVWAVGMRGTMLQTTDGGATWQLQASGTSRDLSGIHFTDRQHGWAVGFANTILKTTDGGETWTKVDDDLKDWLKNMLKSWQP